MKDFVQIFGWEVWAAVQRVYARSRERDWLYMAKRSSERVMYG